MIVVVNPVRICPPRRLSVPGLVDVRHSGHDVLLSSRLFVEMQAVEIKESVQDGRKVEMYVWLVAGGSLGCRCSAKREGKEKKEKKRKE